MHSGWGWVVRCHTRAGRTGHRHCSVTCMAALYIKSLSFSLAGDQLTQLVRALMGLNGSRYRYMDDLLELDRCQSLLPTLWPRGPTPVDSMALLPYADCHPDPRFAAYIMAGLSQGFRVGFDRRCSLRPSTRNHPSSLENRLAVDNQIEVELTRGGALVGPILPEHHHQVHISPIGLVPKPNSNRFRMIVDLSSPKGASVNEGIDEHLCSLQYASIDNAITVIQSLGHGTLLVKMDLKDAYRIIPVHPQDHHLLGIQWHGNVFIDRSLPFGLRSAPKVFTAFADMVTWALHRAGVPYLLHYLDDFLLFGSPGTNQATTAAAWTSDLFKRLHVPVADHKTMGPATALSFLGVWIDTDCWQLRLPEDKIARLRGMLVSWKSRRVCTRKELESFTGHLAHAAVVIRQGRIFLRSLFSLLARSANPHYRIRLNTAIRADLQWWSCFLHSWNGRSLFPLPHPTHNVYSDASGSFGCGAFECRTGWFQLQWPPAWLSVSIAPMELAPIVMAAAIWGKSWAGCHIAFHSDNMAVVAVLNKRTAKDPLLIHLLRCLYFYSAFYGFHYSAMHVPGVLNVAADALSRGVIHDLRYLVPQVLPVPSQVPDSLKRLLLDNTPDWTSDSWIRQFSDSLAAGSRHPQSHHTDPA